MPVSFIILPNTTDKSGEGALISCHFQHVPRLWLRLFENDKVLGIRASLVCKLETRVASLFPQYFYCFVNDICRRPTCLAKFAFNNPYMLFRRNYVPEILPLLCQ